MKENKQNNSVSYLLVQVCKQRRNKSNLMLSKVGIHSGQDILLYYLSLQDGQTVSSLAEKMCVGQATIFNMIKRMAANNLIKKEKDEIDKRISRIYLTKKGKIAFQKVAEIWKLMEKNLLKGISDKQESQLQEILLQLSKNLE